MNQEKIEKLVREATATREHFANQPKGGQQTNGTPPSGCTINHPDINITIFYNENRSFSENQRMARILFREALKMMT